VYTTTRPVVGHLHAHLLGGVPDLARVRSRRGLDVGGDPEAEETAVGARRGLPLPERADIDELLRPFDRLVRGHAREAAPRDHGGPFCASGHDVAQPDVDRLLAELARDEIDDAFAQPRLRGPRPAVRDVARLVRDDRGHLACERADPVRPGDHAHDRPADDVPHRRVRAGVDRDPHS
jgi:hypothetical protein